MWILWGCNSGFSTGGVAFVYTTVTIAKSTYWAIDCVQIFQDFEPIGSENVTLCLDAIYHIHMKTRGFSKPSL